MSSTPNFFRVSKNDNPLQKLTGITTLKQAARSLKKLTKGPKEPDIPDAPNVIEAEEKPEQVTVDASNAQRRKKKGIRQGGKQSTVLSGIQSAIKKRLGE